MGELLLIKGVIQHFDQWKCPKRNAELVVVDLWGFKISTLEPLAAHCLFCVLSMPASQMTREQWLEFLMRISQERICLSCWAPQLRAYLSEWGSQKESHHNMFKAYEVPQKSNLQ